MNQMIKQIALSFEGIFKKKKLVLNLVFSEKEQFVKADTTFSILVSVPLSMSVSRYHV